MQNKICTHCEIEQPIENFCKSSFTASGYQFWCKSCHKPIRRNRYLKDKNAPKRHKLMSKYKMTWEDYQIMISSQEGKCFICKKIPTHKNGLSIDHNHTTGKVRALLCSFCNVGLGNFKEDIEIMKNAILYLEVFGRN